MGEAMSVDQSNDTPVPSAYRDPAAFLGNIAAGFRLALFMPVQRSDFRADVNQAVFRLCWISSMLCHFRSSTATASAIWRPPISSGFSHCGWWPRSEGRRRCLRSSSS
jgi:hypothetical protein